jgi:hypothetical protein
LVVDQPALDHAAAVAFLSSRRVSSSPAS